MESDNIFEDDNFLHTDQEGNMRKLSSWNRGAVRVKNRGRKSTGTLLAMALVKRLDREEKKT